ELGVQHRPDGAHSLEVDQQHGAWLVAARRPALDDPAPVAGGYGHRDPQVAAVAPGAGVEVDGEAGQLGSERVLHERVTTGGEHEVARAHRPALAARERLD